MGTANHHYKQGAHKQGAGLKILCWTIFCTACFGLLVLLDPLGLGQPVERLSKDIFYRAISPFYPTNKHQEIVVILLDEESLILKNLDADTPKKYFNHYPPSYAEYAKLINVISHYKPAILFTDLMFIDYREPSFEWDMLIEQIESAQKPSSNKASGMKLYFANSRTVIPETDYAAKDEAGLFQRNDIGANCDMRPRILFEPEIALKKDISAVDGGIDGLPYVTQALFGNYYGLYGKDECSGEPLLSPALTLYLDYCQKKGAGNQACDNSDRIKSSVGDHMSVRWGYAAPQIDPILNNIAVLKSNDDRDVGQQNQAAAESNHQKSIQCEKPAYTTYDKSLKSGQFLLSSLFAALAGPSKSKTCFYHQNIGAARLMNLHEQAIKAQNSEIDQALTNLFQDNIILFGVYLKGVDDTAYSPVHGRIPGVMIHAMALDNLIHFGAHSISQPQIITTMLPNLHWGDLSEILIWSLLFLAPQLLRLWMNNPAYKHLFKSVKFKLCFILAIITTPFIIFLVQYLLFLIRHEEPINWISSIILYFPIASIIIADYIKKYRFNTIKKSV